MLHNPEIPGSCTVEPQLSRADGSLLVRRRYAEAIAPLNASPATPDTAVAAHEIGPPKAPTQVITASTKGGMSVYQIARRPCLPNNARPATTALLARGS